MPRIDISHLTLDNLRIHDWRQQALRDAVIKPELFYPYLLPCRVRLLIVVDGLDFSGLDFGLSTFVQTLLDIPGNHVRFQITLAHIFNATPDQLLAAEPRIHRRIDRFRFDLDDHFTSELYDEVLLFGIATSFVGRGNDSTGTPYPTDRLSDRELGRITQFLNARGGLFATGDHGSLGRPLSHAIPRARGMRLWQSTSAQDDLDQVSMVGQRRNDTNRLGADGVSQFDDQSDDVPQQVQPKLYSRTSGFTSATWPHPLLCGPSGVIRVMPDHPHEGECVEPSDTGKSLVFDGEALGPEYPPATDGGPRPLPEVISTNTVLSGTTSSGKQPTLSQSFGGIAAYDGHRAGIGRVVTDATWHHFVNINLVGDADYPNNQVKGLGFLASPTGQAHFEAIKAYFRNIAVWLAPPERLACMHVRLAWRLVWHSRVLEAVLTTREIKLESVSVSTLRLIGVHARDVLGRTASRCQSLRLVLDLVLERAWPELVPEIDPWLPETRRGKGDDILWFDPHPVLDIAFGAALVALKENFPDPDPKDAESFDAKQVEAVIAEGARLGVARAQDSVKGALRTARSRLKLG